MLSIYYPFGQGLTNLFPGDKEALLLDNITYYTLILHVILKEAALEKSIIIIGGGLTGLSAGCYGRINGYKTSIFEMHDKAGGVATAWKRQGYTIDGAMNWLVGTRPGAPFYNFFEDLGAAKEWKIYNHDRYSISEGKDGKAFTIYCNADQFEKYLLEIAPEDKEAIQEFTEAIRTLSQYNSPVDKPGELYGPADFAEMAKLQPMMAAYQKWGPVSGPAFAQKLKNPYLREIFAHIEMPMVMILMVLAYQHSKSAGYVLGGALALVKPIEKRYRKLGGEINFKSRVVKILVENNKAVGVKLEDGTEHRADWVISAADGHATIYDMLGGRYIDDTIKNMYDKPNLFQPLFHVGLGVKRIFDDIPSTIGGLSFPLQQPITIAGREEKNMSVFIYNFDPSLAPKGKTVVTVYYGTDYDYWEKLKQDQPRYEAEKERICNEIIAGLEQRFPGITEQVEMRSVATPMTWVRYTGNWRGSYEGWMFGAHNQINKTLPGLDNFYMAGQWVNAGGGMCTAVMSGNHTLQLICKKDGKKFVTSKP
jgi:phytoene dehydrogenase-like protein